MGKVMRVIRSTRWMMGTHRARLPPISVLYPTVFPALFVLEPPENTRTSFGRPMIRMRLMIPMPIITATARTTKNEIASIIVSFDVDFVND